MLNDTESLEIRRPASWFGTEGSVVRIHSPRPLFLRKSAHFSLVDCSVSPEWTVPQIALCAFAYAQRFDISCIAVAAITIRRQIVRLLLGRSRIPDASRATFIRTTRPCAIRRRACSSACLLRWERALALNRRSGCCTESLI